VPPPVEVVDGMGRTWLVSLARTPRSDARGARSVVTFGDVTESVALKERLDRSERLALMGSLMSGVAHEVRNPLFAISANADALDLELGEREDVGEMLAALREGVGRLRRVLEDLLDFGRSAPAAPATGMLSLAIQRAMRACDELVRGGGIRVLSRVPECLVVHMDERRLARAVESVLGNALLWAKGAVEIELQPASESERTGVIRLLVRDDGPGFEPEDLLRAFEPFFSRRRGATGLGLTIAQRILDQYGGSIAVANQDGGGGLVTLTIPALTAEEDGEGERVF
jgi:signal transduction histidine kinase